MLDWRGTFPPSLPIGKFSKCLHPDEVLSRSKSILAYQYSDVANANVMVAAEPTRLEPKAVAYAHGTTGENALGVDAFSEDLEQQARQVVGYVMTLNGQQLLRNFSYTAPSDPTSRSCLRFQ